MYSSNKFSHKLVVSTLLISMLFQSFEAVARVGGARSSLSSSHSVSNYGSSSQRAGAGSNAGMQRPDVMNNVRQEPTYQNGSAMPNNLPNSQPPTGKPGYGLGTVVGAAAAGAAVGYMANSAMHNNNQGVPAGSSATGQFEDPLSATSTANHGFSLGGILMFLLGAAAIVGILIMMTRRRELAGNAAYSPNILAKTAQRPATDFVTNMAPGSIAQNQQHDFERNALTFFNELQAANNRGDIAFMQERTTEPLQSALIYDIQNRANPSRTKVVMMDASLVDMTKEQNQQIASVRFAGMVSENENSAPEQVDEVWHFVQPAAQDWKLAGIEQV